MELAKATKFHRKSGEAQDDSLGTRRNNRLVPEGRLNPFPRVSARLSIRGVQSAGLSLVTGAGSGAARICSMYES